MRTYNATYPPRLFNAAKCLALNPPCRTVRVRCAGWSQDRYVIRFRGNSSVMDADGHTRLAAEWVGKCGRRFRSMVLSATTIAGTVAVSLLDFGPVNL